MERIAKTNLFVPKLMVIEFNRILAKGLQTIKNSLFIYLFNQEPSHANAHDAKLVPLFLTQLRSQDPIDPSKSQTISPASLQMSSIA